MFLSFQSIRFPRALLILILALVSSPSAVMGQVPLPVPVPSGLLEQERTDLFHQRSSLLDLVHNLEQEIQSQKGQCLHVDEEDSNRIKFCQKWRDTLNVKYSNYVNQLKFYKNEVAAAIDAERQRLKVQNKALTEAIERDLLAMHNLGFDRRAQDFEEWEKFATDARRDFEHTVSTEVAGLIASKAKEGILSGVKKLDEAKVAGWIEVLMKQDPPPTEIIAVLRRMASVADGDSLKLATDAKYLAKLIENVTKTVKVNGWKDGLPVLLEIICDAFPSEVGAQCQLFKATASITVASLYNNVARRIAINEVERLTAMTEVQLRGLARLNELMVKHVKDRNDVRIKLKERS